MFASKYFSQIIVDAFAETFVLKKMQKDAALRELRSCRVFKITWSKEVRPHIR